MYYSFISKKTSFDYKFYISDKKYEVQSFFRSWIVRNVRKPQMASPNSENESEGVSKDVGEGVSKDVGEGVSKDVGVDTFLKVVNVTTTIRKTWL